MLGSGIMGSRIACHFANIGVQVLLLDMVPTSITADEQARGLDLNHKLVRNRIVSGSLESALKTNPAALYDKAGALLITTGNFDDNMAEIATSDWVIEVVVENLEIKKMIYDQVEKYRKPGTLISSNTSGIPIHLMAEGRSADFRANFAGTHFFNPPRYLRLLEVIPTADTRADVIDFFMHYGDLFLGKTTVLCKDTPAFIANRIGVYSIMSLLHLVEKLDLSVEEVDKYTGSIMGRPKSATFRTSDIVGLDTMIRVAAGLYATGENDEAREQFKLPAFVEKMNENKWLGDKSKQGFYKKVKNSSGESEILALNLKTLEYAPQQKVKSSTLEALKPIAGVRERMRVFAKGTDKAGEFFRASMYPLFQYCSNRIPEISDDIYRIDQALRAGFGWELGPFEVWDALGIAEAVKSMAEAGLKPAAWVADLLDAGHTSFYKIEAGENKCYDPASKTFKEIPGYSEFIILDALRAEKTVWKNNGVSLIDLGDGILNCEFHTKMNTLGSEVIAGINKAIDLAEKEYRGLVIGNAGANFSAGANVGEIFMAAVEQEWDEIDMAIRAFQNTTMRVRYSAIPVVVAAHHLTLGGGCELCLHADFVQLNAETYMGLVEFGVGLIPGGGGSKEFALRASDEFIDGEIDQVTLRERFLTVAMAKVSTSAQEAFNLGYLKKGQYAVTMNQDRLIADAKTKAIELAQAGYTQPAQRKNIKVLGKQGLGMVNIGANSMLSGNYISEHDKKISQKLGWVLCGGDLSHPSMVSEQYLLDLEREMFLSLCAEKKSLERIQRIITSGKPLRN